MQPSFSPAQTLRHAWPNRITGTLVALILLVGLLDLFFVQFQWLPSEIVARSFDVSREESLGTWVSTSLALFAGIIAATLSIHLRQADRAWVAWAIIALFFVYISFDDAAKFHERLGTAMRLKVESATGTPLASWFPTWGWQIYVAPAFAAMGLWIFWFLWHELAKPMRWIIMLGFALLGSAVGLDFLEGVLYRNAESSSHLMLLAEELLEMLGITTFLYVFLVALDERIDIRIQLRTPAAAEP